MDNRRRQWSLARIALAAAVALTGLLATSTQTPAYAQGEASWNPRDQGAELQATRDQGAEQFVQTQGQRLVTILADKSQSLADRITAFRAAVNEIADVPYITRFVLGKYARTITPDQMQRFAAVFQDYSQDVYQQRLADFHADTLTVTGSLARAPGNVLVKTTVTGGDAKQPTKVSWRVLGSGSNWKVVDVEVSGVSLAFSQREDFVSTVDDNDGSIDELISRLEKLTRRRAAAPAAADHSPGRGNGRRTVGGDRCWRSGHPGGRGLLRLFPDGGRLDPLRTAMRRLPVRSGRPGRLDGPIKSLLV